MRILHVVPTYLPSRRYGGPLHSVHGLCRELARQGHDVHVFTTNVDGNLDLQVPVDNSVLMDRVNVHYFQCPGLRRIYFSPLMQKALQEKGHEFDVIHLHSIFLWPTWAAARYARRTQTPYVVSPRGMLVNDLIKKRGYLRKMIWIKLIEKKNLELASAVHATSAVEAEEMNRFGFKFSKISVIPNGYTLQLKESNSVKTQRFDFANRCKILYLGRLNWKKGIDRLILAMAYVPNVELLIAGNDEEGYVDQLSALIEKHGLEDRIQFIGYVDECDKCELFGRVDALVLPSHSENFGNVVLEAMAEKCPVIVTPEVGIAAAVHSSGAGLIAPGEPEQLASAIARICSDESLRIELGRKGRQLVEEEYSWSTIAGTMSELYSDIVDSVSYEN